MTKRDQDILYSQLAPRMSNRAIARHFSTSEASVRRGLARVGYSRHLVQPLYPDIELDTPIEIVSDRIAITADWHVPLTDYDYVNDFLGVCRKRKVKDLLIGGDFFNFDALSMYDPKQDSAGLERELSEGIHIMETLLETFDRIYYIWGNHDARLHRSLGFKIQFAEALKLVFGSLGEEALERITFSNLDHANVTVAGEKWYVCHPQNYSRVPLSTPRTLAAKFGCNVVTAHSHHSAIGFAINGQDIVAEAGGFFDKTKTAYLQRSTTFPSWVQGYMILDATSNPHALVHSPRFANI